MEAVSDEHHHHHVPEEHHHDQLISTFLEIAPDQTEETVRNFLQRTNWNIEEATNLYFTNRNYQDSSTSRPSNDSRISSLYDDYLFQGSFHDAKSFSIHWNVWLIVNLKSDNESTLNRDIWLNDAVVEIVKNNFVLWQVNGSSNEGKKVLSFYKIDLDTPVVLLIDPITGAKMIIWSGEIETQSFVEDLKEYNSWGPYEYVSDIIRRRYPEAEGISWTRNYSVQEVEEEDRYGDEEYEEEENTDQDGARSWGWGEELVEEDNDDYGVAHYGGEEEENADQGVAPSGDEEETSLSRNLTGQVIAASSSEEFEKEGNNNQFADPSRDEEFEKEENTKQLVNPFQGEESEKKETCLSRNLSDQVVAPLSGEEFEKEGNNNQIAATSRDKDIEKEDNTKQVVNLFQGEESEKEETCLSRNLSDQVVAPLSGEEFKKEGNNNQIAATSRDLEFEKEDNTKKVVNPFQGEESEKDETCLPRNLTGQVVPTSSGEEFEKEGNNNQIADTSRDEEFVKEDNTKQVVNHFQGEKSEKEETCLSRNLTSQVVAASSCEEFEKEGNNNQIADSSRDQEFVKEDNTKQVVNPFQGEESEKEETCLSRNLTSQVVAASSCEEFEKEGNNNQIADSSRDEDIEKEDNTKQVGNPNRLSSKESEKEETCLSRNLTDQVMASSLCENPIEVNNKETCLKQDNDQTLVCNLCLKFPDGTRKQRRFLKTEPIQLLWSFCYSHIDTSEKRLFKLVQAIPGASKTLDYEANVTFDQSGLANSMILVTWE